MLTIGQLAAYVGVTVRAVRHYHQVGLLPEPERDASGYRTYGALAVVELTKIRTLADAGVPLSQVRELLEADEETFAEAVRGSTSGCAPRSGGCRSTARRSRSWRPATAWSSRRRWSPTSTGCGSSEFGTDAGGRAGRLDPGRGPLARPDRGVDAGEVGPAGEPADRPALPRPRGRHGAGLGRRAPGGGRRRPGRDRRAGLGPGRAGQRRRGVRRRGLRRAARCPRRRVRPAWCSGCWS